MVFRKKKVEAVDMPEVDESASDKESTSKAAGTNKGISKIDLAMRIVAAIATLGSAVAMGTSDRSSPSFSQFTNFKDQFRQFPTFTYLMVINCIACGYLVFSLILSIFHIFKSTAKATRVVLIIFDTVIMAFLTAGASAAAAVVNFAHKGNANANWLAICPRDNSFCERVSGSLGGSFLAILLLVMLILFSAIAISRS
ncbi:OLC1v1009607C1 [Oldenlandia corymbosa var. corymbosa]|uniref:CASP-like protein n=1 Tax=Oldenlandia corymbosa var. corymbosa TaxID=529605 RepID=A0AAV1DPF4_OLDCO|nr:OLC1v1009607C1 [Oldenlandia corymbosa var. corymbosa]